MTHFRVSGGELYVYNTSTKLHEYLFEANLVLTADILGCPNAALKNRDVFHAFAATVRLVSACKARGVVRRAARPHNIPSAVSGHHTSISTAVTDAVAIAAIPLPFYTHRRPLVVCLGLNEKLESV